MGNCVSYSPQVMIKYHDPDNSQREDFCGLYFQRVGVHRGGKMWQLEQQAEGLPGNGAGA